MLEPAGTTFEFGGRIGDRIRANEKNWFKVAPQRSPRMVGVFQERKAGAPTSPLAWVGEYAGKYLIGAVQALRLSGNAQLRNVIAAVVHDLIAAQGDDGYLGPFSPGDRLARRTDKWDLWGHYHCMLGLLLWHQQQNDPAALTACRKAADLLCTTFIGTGMRIANAGGPAQNPAVAHVFALLYRAIGDAKYLQMVRDIEADWARIDGGNYLEGFLHGEAFYQGRQPRWESLHSAQALVELFAITGDERYRRAFTTIWWSILAADCHVTGGFSSLEKAVGNPFDPRPIETCATVGWMCLTVDMLRLTSEARAADELERATWNAVLGSQSPDGTWWTYDTPMGGIPTAGMDDILFDTLAGPPRPVGERCPTFYDLRWQERLTGIPDSPGVEQLSCCALNGPRGLAMLSQWAVMRSADGLVINYYGPCEFKATTPAGRSVVLKQKTDYPIGGAIRLIVTPQATERFVLRLRIPGWSNPTAVAVNGTPWGPATPGVYLPIDRAWSAGDVVDVVVGLGPRFVNGDMTPPFANSDGQALGRIAVYHGPLLLAYDARFDSYPVQGLPAIDPAKPATRMQTGTSAWDPLLLIRFPTTDGRTLTLCDFASAGIRPWVPSRSWRFSRADGTLLAASFQLRPEGTIYGSTHPNESRWGFEDADLTFYDAQGRATTRFTNIPVANGRTRLEGKFLPNPSITHVLTQLEPEITDATWDFVRVRPAKKERITSVRLEPYGRIHGHRHPNEARWSRDGNFLVFFDHTGRPTTQFTISPSTGMRAFDGPVSTEFSHRLEEVDLGWVRGSPYRSWIPAPVPGPVSALTTRPGGTSLFVLGLDGQVWSTYFDPQFLGPPKRNGWQPWFPISPNVFPAGSPVTVLSTKSGGTSLFVLGFDEQVWSTFFDPENFGPPERGGWQHWFPLGPNVFPAGLGITALSTKPNGTSLYVLGFDGQVWSTFFDPQNLGPARRGGWQHWFPLGPNVFPAGSPVSAISTKPMGTNLFVVGFDKQVWSTSFDPEKLGPPQRGGWQEWFSLGPNVFPHGSSVSTLSTKPNGMSLFVVGFDRQVWSTYFDPENPGPAERSGWQHWFPLGPKVFPTGSPLTAVSTMRGGTSLYAIASDGQVWSKFFPDTSRLGEWSPWYALGPNVFAPGSPIAALSLAQGATSLYTIGFNSQVWSRFFPDPVKPGVWSGWFGLGRPSSELD